MSDPKRLAEVTRRISRIKGANHPVVVGRDAPLRIEERPWKEVPEPSKLVILQDAIDWSGISNRDQGHILLSEVDPDKINDAQRNRLIDMAAGGGARGEAESGGDEKSLSPAGLKALRDEWAADGHAARVRDFGAGDAATYDARMAEAYRLRDQGLGPPAPGPPTVTPVEMDRIVSETERQWPSHDERLKAASARIPSKSKDQDRGHER